MGPMSKTLFFSGRTSNAAMMFFWDKGSTKIYLKNKYAYHFSRRQTFLSLTKNIENSINICIFK